MIASITDDTQSTFVAIVHGRDGVRFAATAPTRAALAVKLGEHVRRHAAHQLWPAAAEVVLRLLDNAKIEEAIQMYFGLVGSRWDEEWLVTTHVATTDDWAGAVASSVGTIVGGADQRRLERQRSPHSPLEVQRTVMTRSLEQHT